jgi:hypothetical protein
MMVADSEWIEEGWRTFREEVLKKGWPADVVPVLELAFFGGAGYTLMILNDEGPTSATIDRLLREVAAHPQKARRRYDG